MIEGIFGLNGSGKGQKTLRVCVNILLYSEHVIITNFALVLTELSPYLQKHYPEMLVDLSKRVRFLTEEETPNFFTKLPYGYEVELPSEEAQKKGARPDYTQCRRVDFTLELEDEKFTEVVEHSVLPPFVYIIDEAYNYLDARGWMGRSKTLYWFVLQHRKFNSDVIFCSPEIGDLDSMLRGKIRRFHMMRNLAEEKFWRFRKPAKFQCVTYNQMPRSGVTPEKTEYFGLDLELSRCYNTAAGVGVVGRTGADSVRPVKGLHWALALVPLVLIAAVLYFSGDIMKNGFFAIVGGKNADKKPEVQKKDLQNGGTKRKLVGTNMPAVIEELPPKRIQTFVAPQSDNLPPLNTNLTYYGFSKVAGVVTIYLSDGTSVDNSKGERFRVFSDGVLLDGERILKTKLDPKSEDKYNRSTR